MIDLKDVILVIIAAAFSIAWGLAMKRANLPSWVQFTILAAALLVAAVLYTAIGG